MSPAAVPNRLHREGYFRYSRNPMYLGIAVGLLGFVMLCSAAWNFVFPPLFAIIVDVFYIRAEEKTFMKTSGSE